MNAFITIGYKKDGKVEVIASPAVSYQKQKEIFSKIDKGFVSLEIWSKNSGMIKRKRIKESSNISKTSKVSNVPKVSNIPNDTKQEPLKLESKENEQK